MSKYADLVIPSHYRELEITDEQRAIARKIVAAGRRRARTKVTMPGETQKIVVKGPDGRALSINAGPDYRTRPAITRTQLS